MPSYSKNGAFDDSGNLPSQFDISQAERDAREAQTKVELMRRDINRLLLVTEALWTLLKQKHGYSDEDLTQAVNVVDMQDGVLDGRPAKAVPRPCPQCNRIVAAHDPICLFCGRAMQLVLFGR